MRAMMEQLENRQLLAVNPIALPTVAGGKDWHEFTSFQLDGNTPTDNQAHNYPGNYSSYWIPANSDTFAGNFHDHNRSVDMDIHMNFSPMFVTLGRTHVEVTVGMHNRTGPLPTATTTDNDQLSCDQVVGTINNPNSIPVGFYTFQWTDSTVQAYNSEIQFQLSGSGGENNGTGIPIVYDPDQWWIESFGVWVETSIYYQDTINIRVDNSDGYDGTYHWTWDGQADKFLRWDGGNDGGFIDKEGYGTLEVYDGEDSVGWIDFQGGCTENINQFAGDLTTYVNGTGVLADPASLLVVGD